MAKSLVGICQSRLSHFQRQSLCYALLIFTHNMNRMQIVHHFCIRDWLRWSRRFTGYVNDLVLIFYFTHICFMFFPYLNRVHI